MASIKISILLLVLASAGFCSQYNDCKTNKAVCFGLPKDCISSSNCQVLFTSKYNSGSFDLELFSSSVKPDHYIAVGFTNQTKMSGIVSVCHYSSKTSKASLDYAFNSYTEHKNTFITQKSAVIGYGATSSTFQNGQLHCTWRASGVVQYLQNKYNFASDKFHLQLATGPMKSDTQLGYHNTDKIASDQAVSLKQNQIVQFDLLFPTQH